MFLKTLVIVSAVLVSSNCLAEEKASCKESMDDKDVIALDHDKTGAPIEYRRNQADAEKLVAALKVKVADDPSIKQSKYWNNEMLTTQYWLTQCGGTSNCGSKTCPNSKTCFYANVGMAGCRCST